MKRQLTMTAQLKHQQFLKYNILLITATKLLFIALTLKRINGHAKNGANSQYVGGNTQTDSDKNLSIQINLQTSKNLLIFGVSNVKRQYDCFIWRQDNSKNLGR